MLLFLFLQDLYDLLMTFLAEKGISNTFIENLSDLSTQYEQKVYIKFLNDLRKFFQNTNVFKQLIKN